MAWWHLTAAANAVIFGAYLAIGAGIGSHLRADRLWRRSPLVVATAAVFLTASIDHGLHAVDAVAAGLAGAPPTEAWFVSGWDAVTAAVAVWYVSLRGRFPALVHGSAMFEDLRQREQQAMEIHDNVVQGLATAKFALEMEDRGTTLRALDDTLTAARRIITDLLAGVPAAASLEAGDLRRGQPAGAEES